MSTVGQRRRQEWRDRERRLRELREGAVALVPTPAALRDRLRDLVVAARPLPDDARAFVGLAEARIGDLIRACYDGSSEAGASAARELDDLHAWVYGARNRFGAAVYSEDIAERPPRPPRDE